MLDLIRLELHDRVAVVTLNRPEKRNALNAGMRTELEAVLGRIASRERVRAVVVTGAGEAFAAGADIAPMASYTPRDAEAASRHGNAVFSAIESADVPFIAAVNGYALGGGCELALACDMRLCTETAVFGQPEIRLGLIPGYGATVRLPRLVGPGLAAEMIYTGRLVKADEALRIGLVNRVVPEGGLLDEALKLAGRMAGGPAAVGLAKQALAGGLRLSPRDGLDLASRLYGEAYRTKDSREGIAAYLEKRRAVFTGR